MRTYQLRGILAQNEDHAKHTYAHTHARAGSTRYYAVSARRCARAIEALIERRTLGEEVNGVRIVLMNDGVNKRERVAAVLAEAGLSEEASAFAMLSAHKTGDENGYGTGMKRRDHEIMKP